MNGENYQHLSVAFYAISLAGSVILFASLRSLMKHIFGKKDEIDPIVESEIYICLGRKAQAIEVLKQALLETPNRVHLMNKLCELQELSDLDPSIPYPQHKILQQTDNSNYKIYINASN